MGGDDADDPFLFLPDETPPPLSVSRGFPQEGGLASPRFFNDPAGFRGIDASGWGVSGFRNCQALHFVNFRRRSVDKDL